MSFRRGLKKNIFPTHEPGLLRIISTHQGGGYVFKEHRVNNMDFLMIFPRINIATKDQRKRKCGVFLRIFTKDEFKIFRGPKWVTIVNFFQDIFRLPFKPYLFRDNGRHKWDKFRKIFPETNLGENLIVFQILMQGFLENIFSRTN